MGRHLSHLSHFPSRLPLSLRSLIGPPRLTSLSFLFSHRLQTRTPLLLLVLKEVWVAELKGAKYPSSLSSILTNAKSIDATTLIWKLITRARGTHVSARACATYARISFFFSFLFAQRSRLHATSPISARLSQQTHTDTVMTAATTHTHARAQPCRDHRCAHSSSCNLLRWHGATPAAPNARSASTQDLLPTRSRTERGQSPDHPNNCPAHFNAKKIHAACMSSDKDKTALWPSIQGGWHNCRQ